MTDKIIIPDQVTDADMHAPQIPTGIEVPGFDVSGGRPLMTMHSFFVNQSGELIHLTDGYLRATIPPESWDLYAERWPLALNAINTARHSFGEKLNTRRTGYQFPASFKEK